MPISALLASLAKHHIVARQSVWSDSSLDAITITATVQYNAFHLQWAAVCLGDLNMQQSALVIGSSLPRL